MLQSPDVFNQRHPLRRAIKLGVRDIQAEPVVVGLAEGRDLLGCGEIVSVPLSTKVPGIRRQVLRQHLETVQTVLSLREAEKRDKELSITLGNINPDKLEATLKAATKARQDQKDLAKEINTMVTSQYSPVMIEAEKDQDWRASLADIDKP